MKGDVVWLIKTKNETKTQGVRPVKLGRNKTKSTNNITECPSLLCLWHAMSPRHLHGT